MDPAWISLSNAGLEALVRYVHDLDFEFSGVPAALMSGAIVGASSICGFLIAGRIGLLVGGGLGRQINNYLLPKIRNVGTMIRDLPTHHLRKLIDLLISGIKTTVSIVQGIILNQNLCLTDLLCRFGGNSDVQMNIIQNLINFFSGIHGGTYRQITP